MPSPKPRKRPARYADAVRPETTAAAYTWKCPQCPCVANLRGLLREVCAHCTHVHQPPAAEETRHG